MREHLPTTPALFVPLRAPRAAAPAGTAFPQNFVVTFDYRGETAALERL